jgi:hypothetical protein
MSISMHKPDALRVIEFRMLHKCVVVVKMLGHGSIADDMDVEITQ